MDFLHQFLLLLAGMSLFMYGIMLASDNLQLLAVDRIRQVMGKLGDHQFIGILCGIGLTFIMQSSGAVTVMLVNLASAGVVTLTQVMGVILGASIGSTITVQIISFKMTHFSLYFLVVGFLILFSAQRKRTKEIGNIVMGFGILLYGLTVMGDAIAAVKDYPSVRLAFVQMNANPPLAFLLTTVFTSIIHSSAVTIGFAMTLAANGLMTIDDSMFWIYGANLGTTATALMASVAGRYIGRQVAWAQILFKSTSIIVFLSFTERFAHFMSLTSDSVPRQIANAHTIFNIISALLFFPFIRIGARFIESMIQKPPSEREFAPKYLDPKALSEPALAFSNSIREITRMGEIAVRLVKLIPKAFETANPDLIEEIRQIDRQLDVLNQETKSYLVKLDDGGLTPEQRDRIVRLIGLVSDLEHIGDTVEKGMLDLAQKMSRLKVRFSDNGWQEVSRFHDLVVENFEISLSAFSSRSKKLAEKALENKRIIRDVELELKGAHVSRLQQGMQASINTSNIHLEVLASYRRINSYACNLVYIVLDGKVDDF